MVILIKLRHNSIQKYGCVNIPNNVIMHVLYPKEAQALAMVESISDKKDVDKYLELENCLLVEKILCKKIYNILNTI